MFFLFSLWLLVSKPVEKVELFNVGIKEKRTWTRFCLPQTRGKWKWKPLVFSSVCFFFLIWTQTKKKKKSSDEDWLLSHSSRKSLGKEREREGARAREREIRRQKGGEGERSLSLARTMERFLFFLFVDVAKLKKNREFFSLSTWQDGVASELES